MCVGIGLAAACGFRVFVPLLAASVATKAGLLAPGDGWAWIGSWPAICVLGSACAVELVGYYIPWVDHLLDTLATPAATIAGALVAATQAHGVLAGSESVHPALMWAGAAITGGGVAAAVQTGTVAVRATSTITTAGLGNPIVATAENTLAAVLSVLAIVAPIAVGLLIMVLVFFVARRIIRRRRAARANSASRQPLTGPVSVPESIARSLRQPA